MQDYVEGQIVKLLSTLLLSVCSTLAYADVDFFAFTEVRADHVEGANFSVKNVKPSATLFLSGEFERAIFLVEAFVAEDVETAERLQLGWKLNDSTQAWIGRYHNPFGYYHTEYHHGNYLQTSIARPAMVNFGGGGGLVPSHFTGALLEGSIERGEAGWKYSLAAGMTSQLTTGIDHHGGAAGGGLTDFDIFNPKAGNHDYGYTARLAYQPNMLDETQWGGFVSHNTIKTSDSPKEEITLDVAGVFVNYQQQQLRLISEVYYFNTQVPSHHGGEQKDDFIAAYVQAEYAINSSWTPYAIYGDTFANNGNEYLELLSKYAEKTKTVGVRWDITNEQAFKLEYTAREFDHDHSGIWLFNWTAAWP